MSELNIQKGMTNKVTIYLEDEQNFFSAHPGLYEKVEAVIEKCLDEEQVPYESEMSLTIVGLDEMHEINKAYREIDRPTDVLSFPQIEPLRIGTIDWDNLDMSGCMNLDTEEVILGDIILCDERAKEQAESYGHSLEREVCFLVLHSVLHLLGYDHMTPEDEKEMVKRQEHVLQCLSITR